MSSSECEVAGPAEPSGGQLTEVDAVLQISTPPLPWAGRRTSALTTFRGRVVPGWAQLPVSPLAGIEHGITFGLASAPVILKSVEGSHQVPANTPWAVNSDGTWRLVFPRTADLRLIHGDGAVMNAPASLRRPLRFLGTSEKTLRAAIAASTAVWVDERCRQIANLASVEASRFAADRATIRSLNPPVDHDATVAFVMLATWALDQQPREIDPRLDRIVEHVDAHLADPTLSTDTIAAGCAVSRRTLQTLLADQGGVASYVRRRRLVAALDLLTADVDSVPDPDEVAQATGLGSRRTLERAMRQVYGLTPRQARSQVLAGFPLQERDQAIRHAS